MRITYSQTVSFDRGQRETLTLRRYLPGALPGRQGETWQLNVYDGDYDLDSRLHFCADGPDGAELLAEVFAGWAEAASAQAADLRGQTGPEERGEAGEPR